MDSQVLISVKNLSKSYFVQRPVHNTLTSQLSQFLKKVKKGNEIFFALKDISFNVEKGDVVGIIGKNGAGKSTLLKILSQITSPTTGSIESRGRIASLLEVGTGFHPELTGRENIFLNGTILGMTRKEIRTKFDEIVTFSGVGNFIDTPVKHYSSGMYVRLAFSVAAHLDPEILIVDEVLAVGDSDFQKKCLGKMKEVSQNGRTVLFVSHHLGSVRQLCNKGILLENGQIRFEGNIDQVIHEYQKSEQKISVYRAPQSDKDFYLSEADLNGGKSSFYHDEKILLNLTIKQNIEICNETNILVRVINSFDTIIGSSEICLTLGKLNYTFELEKEFLSKGSYKLNIIIYRPAVAQYDNVAECCNFEILDNNQKFAHLETFDIGNVYLKGVWL